MRLNEMQKRLYENLMALCERHDAFTYSDQIRDERVFRIFSYRLATYTQFCEPGALECRGVMFEMDRYDMTPVRMAAMPFEKFFNLGENPFTQDVDFSKTKNVYTKEDGSLISTYMLDYPGGPIGLKSKASLWSEQAQAAEAFMKQDANLLGLLSTLTALDLTVSMEWVSPDNRIVLGYNEPQLIILAVRDMDDGAYLYPEHFDRDGGSITADLLRKYWVKNHIDGISDMLSFISSIPNMEGIEGFVVTLDGGQKVKIKTDWYLTRHRLKDSISNPRHLMEAIVTEAVDDIKVMFNADPITLKVISDMEELVIPQYNRMIATVEKFYEDNKQLDRKSYAIKAQSLNDGYMSLYMNLYLGRQNDYAAFAVKYCEKFGVHPLRPD